MRLDEVFVNKDAGLTAAAVYDPSNHKIIINPLFNTQETLVHELVHAIDDKFGWDVLSVFTENAEALAYACEQFFSRLDGIGIYSTLLTFNKKVFKTSAQAQKGWEIAWKTLNNSVGTTVFYRSGYKTSRALTEDDLKMAGTLIGIRISAKALLPVDNSIVEAKGFPANTFNNNNLGFLIATFQ